MGRPKRVSGFLLLSGTSPIQKLSSPDASLLWDPAKNIKRVIFTGSDVSWSASMWLSHTTQICGQTCGCCPEGIFKMRLTFKSIEKIILTVCVGLLQSGEGFSRKQNKTKQSPVRKRKLCQQMAFRSELHHQLFPGLQPTRQTGDLPAPTVVGTNSEDKPLLTYIGASLVAQMVKNLPAMEDTWV